jgi:protein tyrosine/serine phosphatase
MPVQPGADRRRIALEGSFNFRDLGGYATGDGRTVRWGRMFRSDGLGRLTTADLERLGGMALTTVVDLRTPDEIERGGRIAEHAGVTYHHLSLGEVLLGSTDERWADPDIVAEHYLQMLDADPSRVREVLELVADDATYPIVFHCAAGKDRTGITAALVLTTLGVPRADVVADYALTHEAMQRWVAWWYEHAPERRADIERHLPSLLASREENIDRLLDRLVERHGSVEGYLADIGASAVAARLRDGLLETAGGSVGRIEAAPRAGSSR